jgi:hypothetical protein
MTAEPAVAIRPLPEKTMSDDREADGTKTMVTVESQRIARPVHIGTHLTTIALAGTNLVVNDENGVGAEMETNIAARETTVATANTAGEAMTTAVHALTATVGVLRRKGDCIERGIA